MRNTPSPRGSGFRDPRDNRDSKRVRINDEIKSPTVRVVDSEGVMLGIFTTREARDLAFREEKDLVEIAPQANPPVCKIIDFGKYQYEQHKRDKQQKKLQHQAQLKEVRFKVGTDTHDFDFKTRHAREFLLQGDKVKASVLFRGREMQHKEFGEELLVRFIEKLDDVSKVDQALRSEGRTMAVTLTPDKDKQKKLLKSEKKQSKSEKTDEVNSESEDNQIEDNQIEVQE